MAHRKCSAVHTGRFVTCCVAAVTFVVVWGIVVVPPTATAAPASSPTACPPSITKCNACGVSYGMSLCVDCAPGYTVAVDDNNFYSLGRCFTYTADAAATCAVANCRRCAFQDDSKCVDCATGPYTSDYQCPSTTPTTTLTSTTTTTTSPVPTATTTTKTPSTSTSTTTTRTPSTTKAPTTTTTTTTTPKPTMSTTSTTKTPCTAASCTICDPVSPSVCVQCAMGYTVMTGGVCKPSGLCSVQNCVQCSAVDDTSCTTCARGYSAATDGRCLRNAAVGSATPTPLVLALLAAALLAALSGA